MLKIIKITVPVSLFFLILTFPVSLHAQEAGEYKQKCQKCHQENIDKWELANIKHFPYKTGKCEVCHAAEHKQFTAEKGKPCAVCHNLSSDKIKAKHFSADVTGKDCFSCHYTHASDKKGLLKEVTHPPFESAMCDMCHRVNEDGKIEQKAEPKKMCIACHSDKKVKEGMIVHMGFEMLECTECHNPHTTSLQKLLKTAVTENCLQCHDKETAAKHPFDVTPSKKILPDTSKPLLSDGKVTCGSCHEPHMAKVPFLLRYSMEDGALCYKCHNK